VRRRRILLIVLAVVLGFGRQASAQSLSQSLFERYMDSLREQAGIPGLSAAIVQDGTVTWSHGFGKADIAGNVAARADTPYVIGGLSQTLGSALLLKKCVDQSYLSIRDRVVRWDPTFPDASATIGQLLTHTGADGAYHFDLSRFAALTPVMAQCAGGPYRRLLATELLDQLAMFDSVPGAPMASPTAADTRLFDAATLARYAAVLGRVATPYRVDRNGHATRAEFTGPAADVSTGVVSTVLDLASFDRALGHGYLSDGALLASWTAAAGMPTGLGWFVQNYNSQRVVWQFGSVKDAYSGLILKYGSSTLILLANSDGLSSAFALENGDVTTSLFARLFLRFVSGQ